MHMGEQSSNGVHVKTKRAAVNSSLLEAAWRQKLCCTRRADAAFQTAKGVYMFSQIQRSPVQRAFTAREGETPPPLGKRVKRHSVYTET